MNNNRYLTILVGVGVIALIAAAVYLAAPRTTLPTEKVTTNGLWTRQFQTFDGVEMALVPPGCFTIGGEWGGEDALNGNQVCFDKAFWIDKTEVTQAQFKRLGGFAAKPSAIVGDNRPVETIKWFEARDYCAKRGGRLPSEAEWEYAARGPDNLILPWGNTFDPASDDNKAVFMGNSNYSSADVGSKPAGVSWVGALDMAGNVYEWTNTIFKPYPYDANDGRETNTNTNEMRVLRGGSFLFGGPRLTAVFRNMGDPSLASLDFGFRCVRS